MSIIFHIFEEFIFPKFHLELEILWMKNTLIKDKLNKNVHEKPFHGHSN